MKKESFVYLVLDLYVCLNGFVYWNLADAAYQFKWTFHQQLMEEQNIKT